MYVTYIYIYIYTYINMTICKQGGGPPPAAAAPCRPAWSGYRCSHILFYLSLSLSMYTYIYIYIYTCKNIYIYIYISCMERMSAFSFSMAACNRRDRNPRHRLEPQIASLDKCKISTILLEAPIR